MPRSSPAQPSPSLSTLLSGQWVGFKHSQTHPYDPTLQGDPERGRERTESHSCPEPIRLFVGWQKLGCLFSETSSHFSRPWHSLLLQNSPGCRMLSPLHWGAQSQAGVLLTWWPGGCSHMQKKVLWYFKAQEKHWNCIQNSWGSSETGVITPFLYTLGGLQKVHGNMDYDKTIHGFKFFVHHNKLACQVHFSLAFLKYQHTRRKWRSERHSCSRTHCSQVAELGLNLDLQRPNWHHVLLLSVAYFWQRPLAQIKSESSLAKWENNI